MKLLEQAKKLPKSPGVYLFIDKRGAVLYVGRASSLRGRVLSYFRSTHPKIKQLLSESVRIKHQKTDTVLESLFAEANLIKKHWPKYNVKDRDDRSFIYLVIAKTDYPYPLVVRERELKKFTPAKAHIFGPYQSARLVKTALRLVRRIFPYSRCRPFSGKPCFDYQVGLCPGLCVGEITKREYQQNIKNLALLLKGEKKRLLAKLKKQNPDKIEALAHIQDVALITKDAIERSFSQFLRIEGYDVSHLSGKETVGSMIVFTNGEPDKGEYRLFKIRGVANNDIAALEEVITRRFGHPEWPWPNLIFIDGGRPQVNHITGVLKKNSINLPLVGISKLGHDKLVFPSGTDKIFKELAESMKPTLLAVRDEAHRFALKFSRRHRQKRFLEK